jgi:hypothetical protein
MLNLQGVVNFLDHLYLVIEEIILDILREYLTICKIIQKILLTSSLSVMFKLVLVLVRFNYQQEQILEVHMVLHQIIGINMIKFILG